MASDRPMNWLDDDQRAPDHAKLRYVIAGEENGTWTVLDRLTGVAAVLEDHMLIDMTFELADDMVELMNRIEADATGNLN